MIVNDLISSVSRAIFGEFGDKYKIYAESVEQGLEEPCFFVQCIRSELIKQYGSQARMLNSFCVQYFPQSKLNPVGECNGVSERLFTSLEYVSLNGNPTRSTNKSAEIHDGVLSFFLNFNLWVKIAENKTPILMKRLDKTETEVKL